MVCSKELFLKKLLKYFDLNDSVIKKVGNQYLNLRNVEEVSTFLNGKKKLKEIQKTGLILLNLFVNDTNNIIVNKYNNETKGQNNSYFEHIKRYSIENFKKLEKIVNLANENPTNAVYLKNIDIESVDYCKSFIKYEEKSNSEDLNEEKERIREAFFSKNNASFLKLFETFYKKIEKLPELKRKYAMYVITDEFLFSKVDCFKMFENILNYIILSKEELSEYIYLSFRNFFFEDSNFNKENYMDYIKTKIEELNEFTPSTYAFGFQLINNNFILRRKDKEEILNYFHELSFDNINENQKNYITNLSTEYNFIHREDYLDKVKFLINFIFTSKTFILNKDNKKIIRLYHLMTNDKLLNNNEFNDIFNYLDTLSDNDFEYAYDKVDAFNMNTLLNLKRLIKLPFVERDVVYFIIKLIEKYILRFKFILGEEIEEEIKSSNDIIDFTINSPKSDRGKIYGVLNATAGDIIYNTNFLEILNEIQTKDESVRNKAYNIATELTKDYIGVSFDKDNATKEIIKIINFLLEVPEDRFKLTFNVVLKADWFNKYKIGQIMASYNPKEQEIIFNTIINYVNQYKDEIELKERLDNKLKESISYDLGSKLFLRKDN